MVTVSSMLRIVRTTENFWDAFLLRASKRTRTIRFRNGVEVEANYSQYVELRDWFEHLHNSSFTIEKTGDGYIIENSSARPVFSFQTCSISTAKPFFDLLVSLKSTGWTVERTGNQYKLQKGNLTDTIEQLEENFFRLKTEEIEIVGPREILITYYDEMSTTGAYNSNNYAGKIVLDIGGYCGETAVFFSNKGAKKVVIYEPVVAHHAVIRKNLQLNGVAAELHDEGIGERDGLETVNFEALDTGAGLSSTGKNQLTIKTKNISDVILESHADVAKVDCEGAEMSLIGVPAEILGLINYYIVETHSEEIEKAIVTKFLESGFKIAREPFRFTNIIAMHYFEKPSEPALGDVAV